MRESSHDTNDGDRESAAQWLLSDKHPGLLPTPWLSPYEFEEFVERLLRAERFLGDGVRHVTKVERWGASGDKQDGVDLVGEYSDGVPATWQCKHLDKLTPSKVSGAVKEVTYKDAEELCLVFSRVASAQARAEMKKHVGWTLLDRGQLTAKLRDLPVQVQRDILDQTWGEAVRRLFLEAPGDAFVSLATFISARMNPRAVMNDLGPLVGREDELAALEVALGHDSDGFRQVVVLVGTAGRGKSRLVTEALTVLQKRRPGVLIVCLAAGYRFRAEMMAELRLGPAIILIDDAHTDPTALAPLLAFAREHADVRLVLSTRPSAAPGIIEQATLAHFGPSELATISVGTLAPKSARRLVMSLSEGMSLSFALINYLSVQAAHSPFVAVVTANLIRRGELTKSLAVDDGLRGQILSRYQELLGADIQGFGTETTQRVLATYTALGSVPAEDGALRGRIADFCALKPIDLVRLVKALRDRGVLVLHGDVLAVVPDVLADHVFESVAAFEDHDSGFVAELWDAFGTDYHHQLALSIGELDWRLARRGGPRVMTTVWTAIRGRLRTPYCGRQMGELRQLKQLAATQPAEVVAILEELRARLDRDDAEGVIPPEDEHDDSYRKGLGIAPLSRGDVRATMPELYARAAVNDSSQLETVLDALWAFCRRDARPTNTNNGHPQRLVTERIANLATLPDESFPKRIVARVTEWLAEPGSPKDTASPLFALKALLAKEVLVTVQSDLRQLQFQPHTVDVIKVRDVRDQIRSILKERALRDDLPRAGEALDLLHEALRQPHGYFNQNPGNDTILGWENDDLATVQVFGDIAERTTVPAVRRRIRHHIMWSAERAVSLRVRHATLTLLARLDNAAGLADDVADHIWNNRFGPMVMKHRVVPTLEELQAEHSAEQSRLAGMTDEQRQADRNARIHDKVQEGLALQNEHLADLARRLLDLRDIPAMLDLLDRTARDVVALNNKHLVTLWLLWRSIADQSPERLAPIIHNIAERHPGPLDHGLYLLITEWLAHAKPEATVWIQDNVVNGRREVKLELANGFRADNWYLLGNPFAAIWATGINDADPYIAQAHLAAAGAYLRDQPAAAIHVLLNRNINPVGAIRAIDDASNHDPVAYGAILNIDDATAMLRLLTHTGYNDHTARGTLAGIATAHPHLVLDHLADLANEGAFLPEEANDLNDAYDTHADVLAMWIRNNLNNPDAAIVIAAALNEHLTDKQAAALAQLTAELDGGQLECLVELLTHLEHWALDHPNLAHTITARARETGAHDQTRPKIKYAMQPHQWGTIDGFSKELNSALAHAKHAAQTATDPDLQADYEQTRVDIQAVIDSEHRENDENYHGQ